MKGLTEKQKEFARLLVEGKLSKADAYRKAFNRKDLSGDSASKAASRLSKNDEVCRYVGSLNAKLDTNAVLSKKERMEWLSRVVRTPLSKVDADSDLCQEVVPSELGDKIKVPSKIAAITELNKMDGAYEPERIEVKSEFSFGSLLKALPSDPLVG
ncbi:MAG: terminase small subunit [Akkermansia sp.]